MVSCYNCRKEPSNLDKWRFSLIGTIIAMLIFNPITRYLISNYMGKFTQKYFKTSIVGYIFSYILYIVLVRSTMR